MISVPLTMRTFFISFLSLLAISTLVMPQYSSAAGLNPHSGDYLVRIENRLGGGATLEVHCKSKLGGDLGAHWIGVGEGFTVRFHNDKCFNTEYWCKLSWGSNDNVRGGNYRLFNCDESFLKFCDLNECIWRAKNDGIYLHDNHGFKDVKYYEYW